MPVLSRSALESSPLADLHEIASELGMDGYRRLRKADLIAAILERQSPGADDADDDTEAPEAEEKPARRSRRGGRGRSRARDRDPDTDTNAEADTDTGNEGDDDRADAGSGRDASENGATDENAGERGRRPRRGRGGGGGGGEGSSKEAEDAVATGKIELLPNGSGFVRVSPEEDDDVYVSAAQVRRCELVDGDEVTGPVRPARRSERHPSLARVDTINGRAADEVAEGTRFEDLQAAFPTALLVLGDDDPTLAALALTPLGRGSRAVVVGSARAGKTEALRRLARVLHAQEELEVSVALAGVRPEELGEWKADDLPEPAGAATLGAPGELLGQTVERAAEIARRVAARGGDAVLLIDSLEHVPPHVARRVLGSARDIVDGGSLTVIAVAATPFGGETTVIALDVALASTNRFPALDLAASGTLRPELLVGDKGAEAIASARTAAGE